MLREEHFQEWRNSGVSEKIITLNVESLDDPVDIDERLNRNTQQKWKHWDGGPGWWVSGADPKTGERTWLGGQFKPDKPVAREARQDGTIRYQKYLSPAGDETSCLFLNHQSLDYWQELLKSKKAIVLTEGAKKSGAVISLEHPCISLPGVWNGQKEHRLKKDLKQFCNPGRRFYLAFDADFISNPNVFDALSHLARMLLEHDCSPYMLVWDVAKGKGIDDYLVGGGNLEHLIDEALTFKEWKKLGEKKKVEKVDSDYPDFSYLDTQDEVTNTTIDDHVFKRIFEGGKGKYMVINSAFYKYSGVGYWAHIDDEVVEKTIAQYTRSAYKAKRNERGEIVGVNFNFAKTANVSSAFNFSRTLLSSTQNTPYNRHLLCFQNCTVDLRTGEILEHAQDHFLTSSIAANYEPNLPCPDAFGEFVYSAFGEDIFEVIQAVTSMYLDPTAPYGQFAHCIGPSGSGKGTLLGVWEMMYGQDNVRSAASLSELSTPEGRYQNLMGVSLFKCPDIGGYQQGLRAFYGLVDNEPMSARPLFSKRNIQVQFNTRFAIGSVQPLQIENSGDGWDRRVIPLPTKERRGPMDRTLRVKLQEVVPQIISWALSMPREKRDFILNNLHFYDRIEAARGEASLAGDPVRSFIDMCLRPAPGGRRKVDNYELHTWYSAYVQTIGASRMGMPRFVNHLKSILPVHYQPRRRGVKAQDGHTDFIPAYWKEMEPLEGVFQEQSEAGDFCKCIKNQCEEGGLWQFADYASKVSEQLISTENFVQGCASSPIKENNTLHKEKPLQNSGSDDFVQGVQDVQGSFEQIEINGQKKTKSSEFDQKKVDSKLNMHTPPSIPAHPEHLQNGAQKAHEIKEKSVQGHNILFSETPTLPCTPCTSLERKISLPYSPTSEDLEWAKGKPDGYEEEF